MINIEPHDVHIGRAIKERFETMGLNKSQLGRMIGIPQQHVNRLFERETIETAKLVVISRALGFNFFNLYSDYSDNMTAYMSAVAHGEGDAINNLNLATKTAQNDVLQVELNAAKVTEKDLRDQIATLKASIKDKEEIITLLKAQI